MRAVSPGNSTRARPFGAAAVHEHLRDYVDNGGIRVFGEGSDKVFEVARRKVEGGPGGSPADYGVRVRRQHLEQSESRSS
ncbi:MAG TPA: hypothetical protein P5532_06215 [Planctomycetota bacterium]|nr:hypothetical protein [Planctomycetota bacterium]